MKRLGGNAFTIVELLIVVVVIAILASVTVTAYSGITTRANDTATTTAVGEWAKLLVLYATETGDYPFTGNRSQTQPYSPADIAHNYPCLGLYPDDICANITNSGVIGNGHAFVNEEFNNLIAGRFGSSLPQPSKDDIIIQGEPHRGAFFSIGNYASGHAPANSGPGIVYYIRGSECPSVVAGYTVTQTSTASGGSRCNFSLPDFR